MGIADHQMVEAEYGVVRQVETGEDGPGVDERGGGGRHGATVRYGIEITVPGVCDRCVIKDNCYGAGSLVWAASTETLVPGDSVRLEMKRGTVLLATSWVYGVPLAAVFLGTLGGYALLFANQPEQPRVLLSFGLGVALMLAAGFVLSRLSAWVGRKLTITARREAPHGSPHA